MNPILSTVHGSHLYGLAHADSDLDTYTVVLEGRTLQSKKGDDDRTVVVLEDFLSHVARGVPQALEALYSPVVRIHPTYAPMLQGLRPGTVGMRERYHSTMKAFAHGNLKMRRHALRLALNFDQYRATGSMRPRLTEQEAAMVTVLAGLADDLYEAALHELSGMEIHPFGTDTVEP